MKGAKPSDKSQLLQLLQDRWTELGLGEPKPYNPPVFKAQDWVKVEEAARAYALVEWSDPFAYARMKLHLMRGLELVSDVLKSSNQRLTARRVAKRLQKENTHGHG